MASHVSVNQLLAGGCALASLLWGSVAYGGLVADFRPDPLSDLPELTFNSAGPMAPALRAGPGSQGNGDGQLPPAQQMPGGLYVETPYAVAGLTGGLIANPSGTTSYQDVTLQLDGLMVSGTARSSGSLLVQPLGAGTFELLATDKETVLLNGYIQEAFIISTGQGQGAVLSARVQYWGGEIFQAMTKAEGLGHPRSVLGELSWSLLNMQPAPAMDSLLEYLPEFTADAVGHFSATVPEPGSVGMLGIALCGLLRRRR